MTITDEQIALLFKILNRIETRLISNNERDCDECQDECEEKSTQDKIAWLNKALREEVVTTKRLTDELRQFDEEKANFDRRLNESGTIRRLSNSIASLVNRVSELESKIKRFTTFDNKGIF